MTRKTLTVRLLGRDGISPDTLIDALRDAVIVLQDVAREVSGGESRPVQWQIKRIKYESPLEMEIAEAPQTQDVTEMADVMGPFVRGLRAIEAGANRPAHFSDNALYMVKRLVGLLNNGLTKMEFCTQGEAGVTPTQHVAAHVDEILGTASRFYYEETELEGRVELLSIHGAPDFWIYDPLTDEPIKCAFKPEHIDQVAELIKRRARVRVLGKTKFNREHRPISVEVQAFERLPDQAELPQIADLHRAGINITGGLSAVEYLRRMRDAQ